MIVEKRTALLTLILAGFLLFLLALQGEAQHTRRRAYNKTQSDARYLNVTGETAATVDLTGVTNLTVPTADAATEAMNQAATDARHPRIYALANNLSVSFTGVETKTALTQTIAGGSIGANGHMVVRVDCKRGTGTPAMKIKFGGVEIATTNTDSTLSLEGRFWNQGAENDNFVIHERVAIGYIMAGIGDGTDTTIDTSANQDVTVELTSGGTGTTIVRGISIIVYYGA